MTGDVRVEVRGRRIIVTGRKAAEGEGTLGRALALIESGIFGTLPTGIVFGHRLTGMHGVTCYCRHSPYVY